MARNRAGRGRAGCGGLRGAGRLRRKYESFILKCASNTSKRYITKSDDEWSVAMEAFCSAIASYSYEKGSFLSFAELLIRRRLIDYFRLEQRRLAEFPVDPAAFTGEGEDAPGEAPISAEITAKTLQTTENDLKDEIEAVSALLGGYASPFSIWPPVPRNPGKPGPPAAWP
jgi:RNA polymerase sigma factor